MLIVSLPGRLLTRPISSSSHLPSLALVRLVFVQDAEAHGKAVAHSRVAPTIGDQYDVSRVLRATQDMLLAIATIRPQLLCSHPTQRRSVWRYEKPVLLSDIESVEGCRVTVQGRAASIASVKELLRAQVHGTYV